MPSSNSPFSHAPMKVSTQLILDRKAVDDVTTGAHGDAMRELLRRGNRVVDAAKRQIRHGHVHAEGIGAGWPPLRDTVQARIERGPDGKNIVVVGSDHPIALIHHDGTRPHIIEPRTKQALAFYKPDGGLIITRRVHHPGTHPNRYLTDNMWLATR